MVLGCFCSAPLRKHAKYLGGRKRPPLQPLTAPTREDRIFADIRRANLKTQAQDARKNLWILEAMWRLVKERVSASRDPAKDQALIRRLECAIAVSLKGNWRRRAEEAGKEVETLLGSDPPSTGKLGTG